MLTSTIHLLEPLEEPPEVTFATIIRPHPVIPILVITRILAASINPISHGRVRVDLTPSHSVSNDTPPPCLIG